MNNESIDNSSRFWNQTRKGFKKLLKTKKCINRSDACKCEYHIKQLHKNEKSAIIRYFKQWERIINQYVKDDGTIAIPNLPLLKKNLRSAQLNAYQNIQSDRSNADWSFLGQ